MGDPNPPRPRRRTGNRRLRRLWTAILATLVGLGAIVGAGWWIDRSRDTDLEDPTVGVTQALLEAPPATAPQIHWQDVALESGLQMKHGAGPRQRLLTEDTGSGLAWGDYDGDGDDDLYVVSFASDAAARDAGLGVNRLFRNDGPLGHESLAVFSDQTSSAGVGDPEGFGMGAGFVDFDADGDLDLYVTNDGPNRLYRNRGDGTFEEVAAELGVDDESWSVGFAWGDLNRDGRLDLYVANYLQYEIEVVSSSATSSSEGPELWEGVPFTLNPNAFDPQPNRLFLAGEEGRFSEAALETGVSDPGGRSLGVAMVDLDRDGWLDLYVANDVSPNALFRSLAGELEGEALFEDWSARTGTADPRGSMGISVARLRNSALGGAEQAAARRLRPDLFITHWIAQENALYRAETADLEYHDKVRQLRLGEISTDRVGWGCGFLDLDLDGRLDLAVANGSTLETGTPPELVAQLPFLLWNGGERFYDLTEQAGEPVATPRVARGLATADYDRDGDVDIALSINRGNPVLWRNGLANSSSRWMAVELDAPSYLTRGSLVALRSADDSEAPQLRFWGADASFASGHAEEAVFGLATAEAASGTLRADETRASLDVAWIDGVRQSLRDLPAGRRFIVRR